MDDKHKTKAKLISELIELRKRVAGLEAAEAKHRSAQAAFKQDHEKLELVFELLPVGVSILDKDNRVVKQNKALETILDISQAGLIRGDHHHRLYLRPNRTPMLPAEFASTRVTQGEPEALNVETGVVKEDGTITWVNTSAIATPFSDWKTVIVTSDITRRRQFEDALRASEEKFRNLVEQIGEIFYVVGMDGSIEYLSPSVQTLMGFTPNELIGRNVFELIHPEDQAKVAQGIKDVAQGINYPTEFRISDKAGSFHLVRSSDRAVLRAGKPVGLQGICQDITSKKQLEKELLESEMRYRTLFEQSPYGVVILDPETSQIIEFNEQACRQLGYSRQEFRGLTIDKIEVDESFEESMVHIQAVIQAGCDEFETRQRTKQGQIRNVHVIAQSLFAGDTRIFHCIWQDITERKQAEKAQRMLEEKFYKAFHVSPDAININRLRDGLYVDVNGGFLELTGYTAEEVIGRTSFEIDIWDNLKDRERLVEGLRTHGEVNNLEAHFRIKNGDVKRCLMSAKLLEINNELCILSITRDITELRRAEENLQTSEQRFGTLFETMVQGVVYQDAEGRILSANPAAERILGLSLEQLRGRSSPDPRWHSIHEDGTDFPSETHPGMIALRTGQAVQNVIMGIFHPQEGNYAWININAIPLFRPGESKPHQVYATFQDISAIKRNNDIMRARLRLLEFARTHTVKELLQQTLDEANKLVFSPIGFYHFVDPDLGTLTLQAWSTRTRKEFCTATGEDNHYPIDQAGVWADCARERRPIIHNDYAALENKRGLPPGHAKVQRELVVPVMRGGQIVAIMGVGNKPDQYNERDLEIVTMLADFSWDIVQQRLAADELRASEEHLRVAADNLEGIIYTIDRNLRFTFVKGRKVSLFGLQADQIVGMSLYDYFDTKDPDHPQIDLVRRALNGETVESETAHQSATLFTTYSPICDSKGQNIGVLGLAVDITERKKHENELHAIATLSAALRAAPSRAEMLPVIVEQIIGLLNTDSAAVEIIDQETGDAVVEAALGMWQELVGSRQKSGTGINAIISQTLQPFYSRDLQNDRPPFHDQWARQGIRGCIGAPLIAQKHLIGFIWAGRRTDVAPNEVELLSAIADITANAIFRSTLHEQTQKDAAELALAYNITLEGWAHALELRDQETSGHAQRVTQKTLELARIIGIHESNLEDIRRGALLHDIGKMGIPDSVLLKPGTLNEREWEIMRRHPEYAFHLLQPIEFLRPALNIPYCHHEKWDGTGYPRGLQGDKIPIEARIFSVVDVWDAITNDRPYRPAWSKKDARKYIQQQAGKHFDPQVVNVFLRFLNNDQWDFAPTTPRLENENDSRDRIR